MDRGAARSTEHGMLVDAERMIQWGRRAALVLLVALAASFGDDRSTGITVATVLLVASVALIETVLWRPPAAPRGVRSVGWVAFGLDVAVCAVALAAVPDPVDPVGIVPVMIAMEAVVRWGARGALGALLAGGIAVVWADGAYAAVGRELPTASAAFRLLAPVVITLPVGLLIERLRHQQHDIRRLFEGATEALAIVSGDRIREANPAARELAGGELAGRPWGERLGPLLGADGLEDLLEERRQSPHHVRAGAPGRERWLAVHAERLEHDGLVLVSARDITQDRRREQDLRYRVLHDPLTGLPNRAALHELLEQRPPGAVGLVFVDLDGFKAVNDAHGHTTGDEALVAAAQRLRDVVRARDIVHRWGGDEFCVVAEPADEAGLAELAARITDAFAWPLAAGRREVAVGASVGTALGGPNEPAEGLIARADAAMYQRKGGDASPGLVTSPERSQTSRVEDV